MFWIKYSETIKIYPELFNKLHSSQLGSELKTVKCKMPVHPGPPSRGQWKQIMGVYNKTKIPIYWIKGTVHIPGIL